MKKTVSIILILAQFTLLFSTCRECSDEKYLKLQKMNINEISSEDFKYFLEMHEDCYDCRDNIGVFINQFNNPDYIALVQKNISDLSDNEFALLLYLQRKVAEYQEKFDYFENICDIEAYKELKLRQRNTFSNREADYYDILSDGCEEQVSDSADGKRLLFRESDTTFIDTALSLKSYGGYFMGGGALIAGGGVLISYLSVRPLRKSEVDLVEAVFLLIGYICGVVMTGFGTGLFFYGAGRFANDNYQYNLAVEELKTNPYGTNFKIGVTIPIKKSVD